MQFDRRLTLEHFRAFVAVIECGGFVVAAERLGRTQSALTHQIHSLETILGERLFNRTRGHFAGLTNEGKRLLPHAHRVLGSVASAYRATKSPLLEGRVRIGVMDDFQIDGLIELIGRFKTTHPETEVMTVSDLSAGLEARLMRNEIDIALLKNIVAPGYAPSPSVLRVEPLHWIVGDGVDLSAGQNSIPVVVFHEGCVYRQVLLEHLARLNLDWRIAYAGYSYSNILAAIQAGLGLAVLPGGHIREGCVVVDQIGDHIQLPALGLTELVVRAAQDTSNPVVKAFHQELLKSFGQ